MTVEIRSVITSAAKILTGDFSGPSSASPIPAEVAFSQRIGQTVEMVHRKRHGATLGINQRTGVRALVDAALTDDVVIHEYLAGVIAAATDEDDNAHLLSLVSRLSPYQLRWHYLIYLATVSLVRDEADPPGNWRGVGTRAHIAFESDFIFEIPSATVETDDVEDEWLRCYKTLKQLEREDLIRIDEEHQYFEETIAFRITRLGVGLLAASAGLSETDLDDLCLAHPKSLLFSPPLQALSVERWTNYVDRLLINHPEYLF
jgi:hypothetical protein